MVFLQDRSQSNFSGKWIADPKKSLDVVTRAAELMLSPELRDYFPPSYVLTFHSGYIDAILREAMRRSSTRFDEMILWPLLPYKHRQRLAHTIPPQILRTLFNLYLRYQAKGIKRRYRRGIIRKAAEIQK